eukprot:TRINITY_DN88_c0_g1_i2.p1 TRINITY_DN88_c0_g1~~TRINITY_DN88_c0_g1_i2.p1  ORF type:complete len:169 (-),score=24.61 TRINITY_DN88_c0_g1_i2:1037-1543(-)
MDEDCNLEESVNVYGTLPMLIRSEDIGEDPSNQDVSEKKTKINRKRKREALEFPRVETLKSVESLPNDEPIQVNLKSMMEYLLQSLQNHMERDGLRLPQIDTMQLYSTETTTTSTLLSPTFDHAWNYIDIEIDTKLPPAPETKETSSVIWTRTSASTSTSPWQVTLLC